MTTTHTPGKLCEPSDGSVGTIVNAETGLQIAQAQQIRSYREDLHQNERRANARRLIACWNSYDGVPTELIEQVPDLGKQMLPTRIYTARANALLTAMQALVDRMPADGTASLLAFHARAEVVAAREAVTAFWAPRTEL